MRTGEHVMHRQQQRQHREQHRARCLDLRVEKMDEDRGGERDTDRGDDDGARPAPVRVGEGEQDLRQPRRRDPGFAGACERVEVGVRHGAVIEDPSPDLDLPERVGILKQRVAEIEEEQVRAGTDAQGHQSPRAALNRDAVGKGKGHAASSSCCSRRVGHDPEIGLTAAQFFASTFGSMVGRRWEAEKTRSVNLVARFVKDESGATAIEYGLIAAGIALAIITVVNNLGTTLNTKFTSISTSLK
ncbi:conserved hypothetical protein [Ricinus communis]|uniref:Flp family type IVb pilin n=1 Tax=Ricinus communis TaxID=3988 RepID=B9TMQ3_RICCO|nr:conserved hypothetical protein [Ricinus communis]